MSPENPTSQTGPKGHNVHLDFARGAAALLVVMYHLQCYQLVFSTENKIFNYFCSLGDESVMVFFVLSGFLVGGSVIEAARSSRWSWTGYAINRWSRLWTVLVPALLLTLSLDLLGMRLNGEKAYHGLYVPLTAAGPGGDYALDAKTFLGNLFFLQMTRTARFGSNMPLWSLANESWYYLAFPLFYFAILGRGRWLLRLFYLAAGIGLSQFLPNKITHLFPIWLMGVLAYLWVGNPKWSRFTNNTLFFGAAFLSWIGVSAISHFGWVKGAFTRSFDHGSTNENCLIGIAFTCMIPYLLERGPGPGWYQALAKWLSKISYTLYLTHFPILAFFFFTFRLPEKDNADLRGYSLFVLYLILILGFAWFFWYLFERRTPEVRKFLKDRAYPLIKHR